MRARRRDAALRGPRFRFAAGAQRRGAASARRRRNDSGGRRDRSASHRGVLAAEHRALRAPLPGIFGAPAPPGHSQRRTIRARGDQHLLPGIRAAQFAQRAGAGMNWLALSPMEIILAWSALAAAALWLYLHHRRPQRKKVSTLRFWASVQPVSQPRRRKLREPWAFLAQIVFLLLVILALANPRWGSSSEGRNVAIVLDASIWSQARPAGQVPWMEQTRAEALRVVDSLPGGDRVLLLRAEADAPPILPFTTDRGALRRAIASVPPSSVAADVPRALQTARAALGGARRGL